LGRTDDKPLKLGLLLAFPLSLGLPGPAAATTVGFLFSGQIATVDDSADLFAGFFAPGDSFQGVLVYDTATPDDRPGDPGWGLYEHPAPSAPSGLTLTIHGQEVASDPSGVFSVQVFDLVADDELRAAGPLASTAAPVDGAGLWLLDGTGAAFDSDALPTALELADFEPPGGGILSFAAVVFSRGGSEAVGTLTSLTPIPEPGTAALLGAGFAVLAAARRARGPSATTGSPSPR
jgi:hypothetical protein